MLALVIVTPFLRTNPLFYQLLPFYWEIVNPFLLDKILKNETALYKAGKIPTVPYI